MGLYEYLIGGKKTGRIKDLKDVIPESKPFRGLKTGESFFVSQFNLDGTRTYTEEIKISSIRKESGVGYLEDLQRKVRNMSTPC